MLSEERGGSVPVQCSEHTAHDPGSPPRSLTQRGKVENFQKLSRTPRRKLARRWDSGGLQLEDKGKQAAGGASVESVRPSMSRSGEETWSSDSQGARVVRGAGMEQDWLQSAAGLPCDGESKSQGLHAGVQTGKESAVK